MHFITCRLGFHRIILPSFFIYNHIFFSVPEMLAMMVDLEDDPEWSVSDDLDDEDAER